MQKPDRLISAGFARGLWVFAFLVVGFILLPLEYVIVGLFVPFLNNKDDGIALVFLLFLIGVVISPALGLVLSLRGILPGTATPSKSSQSMPAGADGAAERD
jgi:hypothetical protein